MCRSTPASRPSACASFCRTPASSRSCRCRPSAAKLDEFAVRQILLDVAEREIAAKAQDPPDRRREGAAGRSARLPHLHLGNHRQPEGCRDRAPEHLQFRAGGGRALRLPSRRPGLPGHDHRVRLLGRGAVGAADRRRHPGARQARRQPGRRRPRRLPAAAQGHRPVLRPDPAGDDREGPAGPAHPAGLGRGLPAQPHGPLASAGPHHPQCLRADRGHRHRDPDRAAPGQAGDHRRAAADLLDRHPRPAQGRGALAGRDGRDRHRRHRARGRLSQPGRPDPEEVHPRLPPDPQQPVRAHLPHRRPRPHQRAGRGRVPRPHRHPGQDPRLPDRADRDRIGAAGAAADRAGGGDHARERARHGRARGLLLAQARGQGAAARRGVGGAAQPAAGLHGAGLSRAPADHPDDGQQQGRSQEAAGPQGPAVLRRRRQVRGAARRDGDDPGGRAGRGAQARAGVGRGQLLQGPGRALAADGALLRQDPAASGPVGRLDARHLPQPDHRQARRPSGRGGRREPGSDEATAVPHSEQPRILRLRRPAAPVLCRIRPVRSLDPLRRRDLDLCGDRQSG